MRIILIIACLTSLSFNTTAQYNQTPGMGDEFKRIAGAGKTSLQHGEGFQSYSSQKTEGSQFFNPEWANGYIISTGNQLIKDSSFQFKFDQVRHELFITNKASIHPVSTGEILMADKSQIRSFAIITDKEHFFVAGRNYSTENPDDFYELLVKNDSAYTLLKYVKTKFVKFDNGDIEKVKKGEFYDEFVEKTLYYISFRSSSPQLVDFREKTIIHAVPLAKKVTIEEYFSNNSQQVENDGFLVNLFKALNK